MENQLTESVSTKSAPGLARKKIVVAGYFGFGNTGDEAILEVTLRDLRESLPNVEVVVVSGNPAQTSKEHSVRAISHLSIREIVDEVESCDLVILGGGGLFHDYWGIDTEGVFTRSHAGIGYYTIFPLLAALLDKPLFLNAIGVGPLFSPVSEQYARMAFEYATAASVRDSESRDLIQALGYRAKTVKVTADPAFRFTATSERSKGILEAKGLDPDAEFLIGVSLREWDVEVDSVRWSMEVAKALDRIVERFDARVVFIPFQRQDSELTNDAQISENVLQEMVNRDRAVLLDENISAAETAGILAHCKVVVGMRLHSIIFAATAHVPVVALAYDPKVTNVMRQLECESYSLALNGLQADALTAKVREAIENRDSLSKHLAATVGSLSRLAAENNALALECLRLNGDGHRELSAEGVSFLNQSVVGLIKRTDERELEQREQLERRDQIIAARDEGIEWMRNQLTQAQNENRELARTNETLQETVTKVPLTLSEHDQRIEALSKHLAEMEIATHSTERALREREQRMDSLAAELRSERAQESELISRLLDLGNSLVQATRERPETLKGIELRTEAHERMLARLQETIALLVESDKQRSRVAEADEKNKIRNAEMAHQLEMIRSRDEGIAWLRSEVANHQRINEALAAANRIFNEELAEKDSQIQVLKTAVQVVELELLGLTISRGWRLLQQFRRLRRWVRKITGRPNPMPSNTRPNLITESREAEWHASLTPLLDEIKSRLAGLAGVQSPSQADAPSEVTISQRSRIRLQPTPHEDEFRAALDEIGVPEHLGRPDVVCFSVIDWQFRFQRPQQIMSQFAANGHRVFYISTTRFTRPESSPRVAVKSIKENIFEIELCSVHQPDVYGESIGGINWNELEASLEELRKRFSIDEAISYVMISSWTKLAQMTKERWGWRIIYDCMDEWDRFPGIQPAIVEAEKELVDLCDLLVVSSKCLADKWSSQGSKLRLARNAVDFNFYLSRFGPNHLLANTKRPIVGYFGAIADWFDLDLLRFIADKRPDYTFVLLGGVFGVDIADLLNRPNVKFLGQQPYELMPKYLYHFDVCMIPFKINAITEATDPVKVYEYLSCGKPVVSVNLPELAAYREHLYIADNAEEFLNALDLAISDKDPQRSEARRALARANDWRDRYQTIMQGLAAETPRASVIIVTHNNLEMTRLCIESVLINTEYPNFEIIVVDNKSEDGTSSYLKFMAERFAQIRIVLNDINAGFAKANNQAIAISTGEYIVLLNNDTVVPPGWLSRLLRHLRHKEVGLVGPVSNFVGNEARIEAPYVTWEDMVSFVRQMTSSRDGQAADINMLAMFCVGMRREVCDEVGPLDEEFGLGMFEDDDYAHRVRLKGYRVICAADVFVHHFGQAAFKKLIPTGEYDLIFQRNLKTYEAKWNIKWSARSNVPLDFSADYIADSSKNGMAPAAD